ncbi:ribonuclease H-like domain, reverse transcriptase, RNA-dependent DNA polymerase [Tanacetum coccineum]|uniref:Ribonuclease H-like domain, reverse transcriptase, RNA-dependent DNA polymerase n=1 Tax=Tanacetum coccineum TaxID=301880 RepID=A0ABQ5J727_9ASTR
MENDELRLYDMDNKIFMKVTRHRNRLYKANLRIGTPVSLLANLKEDTWLWHARLGHLNFESLRSMAQRDLVQGIPTIKHTTQVCDVCLIGKHSRVPFPKKVKARSTSPLDLVYGDLCGPITPPTPSGKKYIFLVCVSRDVKFKEDETWDWKDYMSKHINDEPEWTNFKIGNLEVTNEHYDQETQQIEDDNEFPNNDDDYASPSRDSPLHSQTPHTPSTRSSEINSQVTPNFSTQSYYQSDNNSIQITNSPSHFDHTPLRGFRTLNDLYENTEELLLAEDEPKNYKEASSNQKWIEAMKVELDSINRNNTWELTTLPKGHKAIGLKWVFKTKKDANGNIIKHKARLVAKGYIQQHGIDFEEVFAPVARMETIRLLLAIAANNKWEVHHLDIKSAFLHGDLKEEVYVTQPEGFIKRQDNGKVYRLIKALYGLRQAPHDLIITGTPKKEIDKFKAQMEEKFKMSDLGLLAYYLGIEVTQTNGDISIKQSAYASKILKEARMIDCNETLILMDPGTRLTKITEGTMVNSTEYRSLIGCLRYLLYTRPDLRTKDYGITYKHNGGNKIHGYIDSSYRVNTQEGKGTTGIIFYYGETPIRWTTQKQAIVALSSCELEFIAATVAATQALWLKRLLSKLTHSQEEKVTIQVNNKSAIALMKNLVFHGRSKHIDMKYHFIRECVEKEDIQVEFINGEYQKADILKRALPKIKFLTMRQLIRLKDLRHSILELLDLKRLHDLCNKQRIQSGIINFMTQQFQHFEQVGAQHGLGLFRIQQYLQHEHYALWEVIEFGDSYKVPPKEIAKDKSSTSEISGSKKKGRTVAITAKGMQKRKNDVKARTTLLLALPDEH